MSAMMKGSRRQNSAEKSPQQIIQAIHQFSEADDLLLSPDRMREYSGKWVAAYKGDILADTDLNSLMAQLQMRDIPLGLVPIRFIEKDGTAAA